LHGRDTGAFSVPVGVAGIERTVVVEHYVESEYCKMREIGLMENSLPVP
jgi:hypothetical protein